MSSKIEKSDEEWRKSLTPEQYHVCREKGTERAFTGKYWDSKEAGVYRCAGCGNPLFDSADKYDSGTGWPSFVSPIADQAVETKEDDSYFMRRTEVLCSKCESHLGHVFPDGPGPGEARFCINSAALDLDPSGAPTADEPASGGGEPGHS